MQAHLRDAAGLVPDHHNKTNVTIKRHVNILVSSAYKSDVYAML